MQLLISRDFDSFCLDLLVFFNIYIGSILSYTARCFCFNLNEKKIKNIENDLNTCQNCSTNVLIICVPVLTMFELALTT